MEELNGAAREDICLACGLCCNGVIFADVKLRAGDAVARLQALGLELGPGRGGKRAGQASETAKSTTRLPKLCQPCAAYDGGRCRVYAERPRYCREFECGLLKRVKAGRATPAEALAVIRRARGLADEVRQRLCELGDKAEEVPLSRRFRRVTRGLERVALDKERAAAYGDLTVAMHELHLVLRRHFYPGED